MPDLTRAEKIEGLREVIAGYERLSVSGRRPGIGVYAERRLPALEAAMVRHEAALAEER